MTDNQEREQIFVGPATDLNRLAGLLVRVSWEGGQAARTGRFDELDHDLERGCVNGTFRDLWGGWRYSLVVPYGAVAELLQG